MNKLDASEVFTPSSPATYTFVERHSLNSLLVDSLRTRGKQLIIYGHTGTGKTTLLNNKLNQIYEDFVVSRCTSDMTFHQLVLNAFDDLGKFIISSRTLAKEVSSNFNIASEFKIIQGSINSSNSSRSSEELKPIVPSQLTPQKLASFFGTLRACWVIDDFHKMPIAEKRHLAQWMKVFVDESVNYSTVKIIVIGAVGSAKEVIELDHELNNRVTEILVPFMSEDELKGIIYNGELKLNIQIDSDVIEKISKLSTGVPAVTHQLCLNLCHSKNIYETSDYVITFDNKDFQEALNNYIHQNSGYLRSRYEMATSEQSTSTIPIYYHLIRAFIRSKKRNLNIADFIKYFKEHQHPQSEIILQYLLDQLTTEKKGKAISYEEDSNSWFISDPFFKVYCACAIDLSKTVIKAQGELFDSETIEKSKVRFKEQDKELVRRALASGEYFDF